MTIITTKQQPQPTRDNNEQQQTNRDKSHKNPKTQQQNKKNPNTKIRIQTQLKMKSPQNEVDHKPSQKKQSKEEEENIKI